MSRKNDSTKKRNPKLGNARSKPRKVLEDLPSQEKVGNPLRKPRYKKKTFQAAIMGLIAVFILADLPQPTVAIHVDVMSFECDAGEYIDVGTQCNFTWEWNHPDNVTVSANIKFGDGESCFLNSLNSSVSHEYALEGNYTVEFHYWWQDSDQGGAFVNNSVETLNVIVKNDVPQFDVLIDGQEWGDSELALEDEVVEIEVNITEESNHDLEMVGDEYKYLTFIYDFGEGEAVTSNKSSITHSWTKQGEWPVTVVVCDDQSENQTTKHLTIKNPSPTAAMSIGKEIPSTYSFDGAVSGALPFDFRPNDENTTMYNIHNYGNQDGHGGVLRVRGNGTADHVETYLNAQECGTVEWYFYTTDATKQVGHVSFFDGTTEAFSIYVKNDQWKLYADSSESAIEGVEVAENQWQHVRVDFRMDGQDYLGLSNYKIRIFIDGEESTSLYSFDSGIDEIDFLRIGTASSTAGATAYLDAIGCSFDPKYDIGMNFDAVRETYHATHDFRNDLLYDQPEGWSIDGTTDPDVSGNYFGTDSFTNAPLDQAPPGWGLSFAPESTGCSALVKSGSGSHEKVLDLQDDSGINTMTLTKNFTSEMETGTVEFWLYFDDCYKDSFSIKICQDGSETHCLWLDIRDYHVKHVDSGDRWMGTIPNYLNTWHHYKISWRCEGENPYWQLFIDGSVRNYRESSHLGFTGSPSDMNCIKFITQVSSVKIDALGIVGEGSYEEGDNLQCSEQDISIIHEDKHHQEVVRLIDGFNTTSVKVWDTFSNQQAGTAEWWIKTSDADQMTWRGSLFEDDALGISVYINDSKWMLYRGINDMEEITEAGTPVANSWYHVRLDFASNGSTYLGLDQNNISLIITDWEGSEICNITSTMNILNELNKFKVESTLSSVGIAWLDSVGYSWDLDYFTGTNKELTMSFPTKSNVHFDASQSVDTESDQDDLKYYWQFSDSSTGYGKEVIKSFFSEGLYEVSLKVVDDNGNFSMIAKKVLIHNSYPDVNITAGQWGLNFTLNEGETLLLDTSISEDEADLARMDYYYSFNQDSPFDPFELASHETGGWKATHLYEDDLTTSAGVLVKDPEGKYDSALVPVNVKNVNPLPSAWDAAMVANVSIEILRDSNDHEANFTISFFGHDAPYLIKTLSFEDTNNLLVSSSSESLALSLSKEWKVIINSTDLPDNSWFRYKVQLGFSDGQDLILLSDKMEGDEITHGYWQEGISPYLYDNGNYNYRFPITFTTHVFDPSLDDITLNVSYSAHLSLLINCSNSFPMQDSFILNGANYSVNLYLQNGDTFANITIIKSIFNTFIDNSQFPFDQDIEFTLDPLIDLWAALQDEMGLNNLTIQYCLEAVANLTITATDDDGGQGAYVVQLDTSDGIDVANLAPRISASIPFNSSITNEITFYCTVSDFDQISAYSNFTVANFKSEDVPSIPNDFALLNGTTDWDGDLYFQDNDVLVFSNVNDIINLTIHFQMSALESKHMLKYLKVFLTEKSDGNGLKVNYSLYNFVTSTFDNVSSSTVGNSYQSDRISIISPEYYNSSFHVLLNIQIKNDTSFQFFIDQLRMEYYFCESSEDNRYSHHHVPDPRWDFELNATASWEGDLYLEDEECHVFTSPDPTVYAGHYQGSYSWKDDTVNTEPDDWTVIDDCGSGYTKVISTKDSHEKVVEAYHYSSIGEQGLKKSISRSSGTVEYWIRFSDVSKPYSMQIYDGNYPHGLDMSINGGYLNYYDGSTHTIMSVSSNNWYHFQIEFDTSDDWHLWVNGIKKDSSGYNFRGSPSTMDWVSFKASSTWNKYFWLDAVGFSWDPNYDIGDDEEYEQDANPLGVVAKLHMDGVAAKDKLESATLEYSIKTNISKEVSVSLYDHVEERWTFIQSEACDSSDHENYSINLMNTDYYSNYFQVKILFTASDTAIYEFLMDELILKYTWIKNITKDQLLYEGSPIFTITNGTRDISASSFNSTLEGKFPGSFSFEEDLNGESPQGFLITKTDSEVDGTVVQEFGNHSKVLELEDSTSSGEVIATQSFDTFQQEGEIEFYMASASTSKESKVKLLDSNDVLLASVKLDDNGSITHSYDGHFPATYSWEDDTAGSEPEGWNVNDGNGHVKVIEEKDGHVDVVECYDYSSVNGQGITKTISQSSGTVEYWFRVSDASGVYPLRIYDGTYPNGIDLRVNGGYLEYYDTSYHTITSISSNTWYHLKIEFDCTDDWHLWLNGVQQDSGGYNMRGTPSTMDNIYLTCPDTATSDYLWLDAISFSWDAEHDIGDNEVDTWGIMPYSANQWHHFRLKFDCEQDNYSLWVDGTKQVSDKDYCHVDNGYGAAKLEVSTDESDSGYSAYLDALGYSWQEYEVPQHYPGTESFEGEELGTEGTDIDFVDGNYDAPAIIKESLGNHSKILKIGTESKMNYINHDLDSARGNSTIAFWIATTTPDEESHLQMVTGSSIIANPIYIKEGEFQYQASSTITSSNIKVAANIWYHIKIIFELTNGGYQGLSEDRYSLYINNQSVASNVPCYSSAYDSMNQIRLRMEWDDTDYINYYDAFGFSWDVNYTTGDNVNATKELYQYFTYEMGDNLVAPQCELNVSASFTLDAFHHGDRLDSVELVYDYRSTIMQNISLAIFNFSAAVWVFIQANKKRTEFNQSKFLLNLRKLGNSTNECDFLNEDHEMLIKIYALNATDEFAILLNRLEVQYTFTSNYFLSRSDVIFDAVEGDYAIFESSATQEYRTQDSFTNVAEGSTPSNWDENYGDYGDFEVISALGGHSKVLEAEDTSSTASYTVRREFDELSSGTLEFWARVDETGAVANFKIGDESAAGYAYIQFYSDGYIHDKNSYALRAYSADTWYHVKIQWNCLGGDGYWNVWINDVLQDTSGPGNPSNLEFAGDDPVAMDYFEISFGRTYTQEGKAWIDGWGVVGQDDYEVRQNRYPVNKLNETFTMTFEDMTPYHYERFKNVKYEYTLGTDLSQPTTLYVYLYDFIQQKYVLINTHYNFSNQDLLQGSYFTINRTFINTTNPHFVDDDYETLLKLYCEAIGEFELHVQDLTADYDWYDISADLGYNSRVIECNNNFNSSNWFEQYYQASTTFDFSGQYLITMGADDGFARIMTGQLIEILPAKACSIISDFPPTVSEDEQVQFNTYSYGYKANETRVSWNFGDGEASCDKSPVHSYSEAGTYTIMLYSMDQFGNHYTDNATITVQERNPRIIGPLSFRGVEGKAITLDVEVQDAHADEANLTCSWYTHENELFSHDYQPTLFLDDGEHNYTLSVNSNGIIVNASIDVKVESMTPVGTVQNYRYWGKPGGTVTLQAYAYDSYQDIDTKDLSYDWTIYNMHDPETLTTNNTLTQSRDDLGSTDSWKVRCYNTTHYHGHLIITDDAGMSSITRFTLYSFIDGNYNGVNDEREAQLNHEGVNSTTDTDGDKLYDLFEMGVTNSSRLRVDTDGDLLWDGLNNASVGEVTYGTDPTRYDTDYDGLGDGFEVYGWQITIHHQFTTDTYLATSSPIHHDTDGDGTIDGDEYAQGSDPRMIDSDQDGLDDTIDPYPTKYDADEDGLSDKVEWDIGSALNNTDTDQDGINDLDEYYGWGAGGWKTDLLSADTDHDFIADPAEIETHVAELEDRWSLSQPYILHFSEGIEQATAAQLSLAIGFGETGEYGEDDTTYGIQTPPDLEVSVIKRGFSTPLFENHTFGVRYFSKVIDLMEFGIADHEGDYILSVSKSGGYQAYLEQFSVEVSGGLDPNDDDCDDDGWLDGKETQGLAGNKWVTIDMDDSYYYNNLTINQDASGTFDEFYLDIPYIGRVNDANLNLMVESNETTIGNGNVTIQLLKEELDGRIEDVILIDEFESFTNGQDFSTQFSLDLGNYENNDTLSELYGTYKLNIKVIAQNYTSNVFNVTHFNITSLTWDSPGAGDNAWITDPLSDDTDNDGWTDAYEIGTSGTNPLDADSDADMVYDPNDLDPLGDVRIRVHPLSAEHKNVRPYEHLNETLNTLQFVAHYWYPNDEKGSIYGAPVVAEHQATYWNDQGDGYNENYISGEYWHEYEADFSDLNYYIDIWDHKDGESSIHLWFETWQVNKFLRFQFESGEWSDPFYSGGDWRILGKGADYTIGSVGNSETFNLEPWYGLNSGNRSAAIAPDNRTNTLSVELETFSVSRGNVIAVHSEETSEFAGHYSTKQRMNVINLYVNSTETSGTPFNAGMNSIVIPTELFTDTVLNSKVQNEKLGETPFYTEYILNGASLSRSQGNLESWGVPSELIPGGTTRLQYIIDHHDDKEGMVDYLVDAGMEEANAKKAANWIIDKYSVLRSFEFVSFDTSTGKSDAQSGNVDFIFTLINVAPSEAHDILEDYLCTIILNDTTGETEQSYSHSSGKNNSLKAETLNLHHDVLNAIPYCEPTESPRGTAPKHYTMATWMEYKQAEIDALREHRQNYWWLDGICECLTFLVAPAIALFSAFGLDLMDSFTDFLAFVVFIVMLTMLLIIAIANFINNVVLTFLGDLLWVAIRAALLALIYIALALEVLTLCSIFTAVGSAFDLMGSFSGLQAEHEVNWVVNYGVDTRVGYLEMEIFENMLTLAGWVYWTYWELFDLYIPTPDLDFEMDSILDDPVDDPEAPKLHCGYLQMGNESAIKFNFYTTYTDRNADEPSYAKLYLICPNGTEIEYAMENFNDITEAAMVQQGVLYNKTVDFAAMDAGQYFYYFETEEDSAFGSEGKYPTDHYCEPGPFIPEGDNDPEYSYNYLIYDEINPNYGFEDSIFNFSVSGCDFIKNKTPNQVNLNVLWDNGTIESFSMDEISSSILELGVNETARNITYKTFRKSFKLLDHIDIQETYIMRYFYAAKFSDGNVSVLFHFDDGKKEWLKDLNIIPRPQTGQPLIVGWKVEHLNWLGTTEFLDTCQTFVGPVADEDVVRFWVYLVDANGTHQDHYKSGYEFAPVLNLYDVDDLNNPLGTAEMTWAGNGWGPYPAAEAYFVDILPGGEYTHDHEDFYHIELHSGAWLFNFTIQDNESNTAESSIYELKIWNVGSFQKAWDTMMGRTTMTDDPIGDTLDEIIPGAGLITTIGTFASFIASGLLASSENPKTRMAARAIATVVAGYDLGNSIWGIYKNLESYNADIFLGYAMSNLISTVSSALTYILTTTANKLVGGRNYNLNRIKLLGNVGKVSLILYLINMLICRPTMFINGTFYGNVFIPGEGDTFDDLFTEPLDIKGFFIEFGKLPMEILSLLISSIGLSFTLLISSFTNKLQGTDGKKMYTKPVLTIAKYYGMAKLFISAVSFVIFLEKIDFNNIIPDYIEMLGLDDLPLI